MWYKYLDRQSDNVRIWRRTNLKFNQDDHGALKSKNPWRISQYFYRACRSQGPMRGSLGLIFIAVVNVYLYSEKQKEKTQGPIVAEKKRLEDEKNDKKARDELWYNRFNVPSRPLRTVDNFMTFIASEQSLSRATDYIGYSGTVSAYDDYQKGLDGAASDEDKKMLDYYKESLKFASSHH